LRIAFGEIAVEKTKEKRREDGKERMK